MRRLSLSALALAACASGGRGDETIDASTTPIDSSQITTDMGDLVDAPSSRTLSQTTSNMLEPVTSLACLADTSGTAANNYYRVFDLPALGITGGFKVERIAFQVEHCNQLNGSSGATVAVRVGTYNAAPTGNTLDLAQMTILASVATVQVPEVIETVGPPAMTPGATVTVPISATIPAGKRLLVEIDAPDGNTKYELYMGANNDGETAPAYVLAPECGLTAPTNISTLGTNPRIVHLLITATGTP